MLDEALQLQQAQRSADEVVALADNLPTQAQNAATRTVDVYVDGAADPAWRQVLSDVTTDTIRDTVCKLAGNQMTPGERDREGIFEIAIGALRDNLVSAAFSALSAGGWTGFEEAIVWGQWADGAIDEASAIVASIGDGSIQYPSGQWTRAYVYDVRTCHLPPT